MKRIIALLLAVLLFALMLCACGDKKDDNEETAQLPIPTGSARPNGENDPSNAQNPDAETQQGTGPIDPNQPADPAQTNPAQDQPTPDTPATDAAATTEAKIGLDVEEDYSVEIGPNQGVGGN